MNGFVVAGGAGELKALTDDERRAMVEAVIEHAAGRVPVVVQCGASARRGRVSPRSPRRRAR